MSRLRPRRVGAVPWFMFTEAGLSASFAGTFTIVGVLYVSDIGLSPLQLVLIGTVMEVTAFLFEIPTGVVADTYSRRTSLIVGWFLHGGSFALIAVAPNFETLLVASALSGLAFTFESGAYEAWITDEVGADAVGPIFMRGARASYAGAIVGILAAVGLAAAFGLRAAVLAGGLAALVIAVAGVLLMPETGFTRHRVEGREGWRAVAGTAVDGGKLVRAQPLVALILAITFFAGMSTEALDRLWEAHFLRDIGLPELWSLDPVWWFAVFRVGEMLLGMAGTTLLLKRIQKFPAQSMARVLIVLTTLQLGAILVFGFAGGLIVAIAGYWLYSLTRSLANPAYMTWLNQNITDSRVRATVISFSGQIDAVGQAGGGPVLGAIGNAWGIRAALAASAAVLAPALGLYARALRHGGVEPELSELPPVDSPAVV